MPSEKQIAAARANGAKSRGPVTLQGKRNSSRSRLRHGAYARTHLITPKFQHIFDSRLAGLTAEFLHETEREHSLVRLATTFLTQSYQFGAAHELALDREIRRQRKLDPHAAPDALLATAFANCSQAWLRIVASEHRMFVRFQAVLRTLSALRRRKVSSNPTKCNKINKPKIAPSLNSTTAHLIPDTRRKQELPPSFSCQRRMLSAGAMPPLRNVGNAHSGIRPFRTLISSRSG